MSRYDVTIIGGGSGGLTASRIAASLGASVLLVDKERLGGDCLYTGCVPSKSLIHVARVIHQAKQAAQLGLNASPFEVDMGRVNAYIQGVIGRVHQNENVYVKDVTVRFGNLRFKSPTELLLDGESVISRNTIIATGSRPAIPEIPGLEEVGYLTNASVFDLMHLPASLLVVGGGPIGVEMSQAFARLGTQVTLIQGPDRLLPKEDPDVSELLAEILRADGIEVVTGARLEKAGYSPEQKKFVTVRTATGSRDFFADELLIALGRRPNVEELDLEAVGVQYGSKGVKVDDYLQTTNANIFAIGDVIGKYLFTHVAAAQAGVAARNALVPGLIKKKMDYRVVPWSTFTDPEVARVGLTPAEAEKQHKRVRVVTLPWAEIDRAQAENEIAGFIKLVLAGKKDELVGVHMVGGSAGELLGEFSLAMQQKLSLNDIMGTIHAYPTLASGVQQAAFEAYLSGSQVVSNRRVIKTLLNMRR